MIPSIVPLSALQREYPQAILCDVRYSLSGADGYQEYLKGHIPGARYVSMDRHLAASAGPSVGRHPLPTPESFANSLSKLGIGHDDIVIAYDAVGGRFAARMVWMLRILGQQAALLDGGLQAWQDQQPRASLQVEEPAWDEVDRQAIPWPENEIVSADEVSRSIAEGIGVFDARAPERFRGDVEPLDPKAGHIPGAKNLFFGGNYRDGGNYFKHQAELLERFSAAGFNSNTVCYCGSGVTACNNVLAAEWAGLPRPRLYVGSWSGWSSENRPIAVGES